MNYIRESVKSRTNSLDPADRVNDRDVNYDSSLNSRAQADGEAGARRSPKNSKGFKKDE